MRRAVALAVLLVASLARAAGTPPPNCPIGSNWTSTWTQPDIANGGATGLTMQLVSPCYVIFDTDFVVTVQATDTYCNSGSQTVGSQWRVTDTRLDGSNATSIIGGYGSPGYRGIGMVQTLDGAWVTTVKQRYTGTPTDHRIALQFVPRDVDVCLGSAHFDFVSVIGTTVYDPYATVVDTTPPAAPAPEPIGGCASAGVTPALLGLAALVAAAWPRRRSRG